MAKKRSSGRWPRPSQRYSLREVIREAAVAGSTVWKAGYMKVSAIQVQGEQLKMYEK